MENIEYMAFIVYHMLNECPYLHIDSENFMEKRTVKFPPIMAQRRVVGTHDNRNI